ncbi:uncharacterized protein N7469_002271 [Penicillium citrinum]|uniref:Uncharacterized protein n=1 Tax=Penicillium citrinum TaxID=5077 RepID=A0A9W9PA62_PENCI|nr:uncharacterized protein N7469_002271 [Penicillium citrinum]KAJ5240680.1 hypothetical protein N7469_002271 [Penicillium citrinum]
MSHLKIIRAKHPPSTDPVQYLSLRGIGHTVVLVVPLLDGHTDLVVDGKYENQVAGAFGSYTCTRLLDSDPIIQTSEGSNHEERSLNAMILFVDRWRAVRSTVLDLRNNLLENVYESEIVRLEKLREHYQKQAGKIPQWLNV